MHFAPVPLLPSLPAQPQLHPMAYGAAVHAACRYGHFLKTPKAQQQVAKLWNSPGYDPVAGIPPRRLEELEEETAQKPLKESLDQIAANRESLEQLKKVIDVPKPGNTEADMETLLNLMGQEKPRAASPYQCSGKLVN
jgi:hypothetical protein